MHSFRGNKIHLLNFSSYFHLFWLLTCSLNSIRVTSQESGIMTANRNIINNFIFIFLNLKIKLCQKLKAKTEIRKQILDGCSTMVGWDYMGWGSPCGVR